MVEKVCHTFSTGMSSFSHFPTAFHMSRLHGRLPSIQQRTGYAETAPQFGKSILGHAKTELQEAEDKLAQLNYELDNSHGVMKKLDLYYGQFRVWAEKFEDANLD